MKLALNDCDSAIISKGRAIQMSQEEYDQIYPKSEDTIFVTSNIAFDSNAISASNAIDDVYEEIKDLRKALEAKVVMLPQCQNCGGQLEINENEPVFHCKYCGATGIYGIERLKSKY